MEQLNYNDFNKFLVSLGVILIGLAVLVPWLFLKESYNLYNTEIDIHSLPEISKEIFISKQTYLLIFSKSIPWFSISSILSGLFLVVFGLLRWYKKQLLADKKDNLEIEKLIKEIQLMSPVEIIDKAQKNSRDDSVEELLTSREIETNKQEIMFQSQHPWKKYIEIEREISDLLFIYNSVFYEILPNVKVDFTEIDILLKAKSNSYFDKIIEIKYYKSGFRSSFLNMLVSNVRNKLEMYQIKVKRVAIPIIIFVLRQDSNDHLKIAEVSDSIISSGHEFNLENLYFEFIKEEELKNFDFGKILEPVKK